MKHILNNLTKEEKDNILKQHSGGMKVMSENFNRLMGAKHGNAKPLINEQVRSADAEFYSDNSHSRQVRSADAEFYSDNSHSRAENGLVYLKNGDKDEVSDLLSNLPSDTTYMVLLDCERADFRDIDLKDFKSLAFINLKGTPNNLLKTNGHSFEDNGGSFYVPKDM